MLILITISVNQPAQESGGNDSGGILLRPVQHVGQASLNTAASHQHLINQKTFKETISSF
jgi:hypothetical protein